MQQKAPPSINVHPWAYPSEPHYCVHVDFVGPILSRMFLVMIDAHCKWPEVDEMLNCTALKTIQAIRTIFGRNRLPKVCVSDKKRSIYKRNSSS